MKHKEFSTEVRVYIEDTDAGGVVYYVNYLKFMERARSDFLRELGFAKPALLNDDLLLLVASASIDYKRSARLEDLLEVTAYAERVAKCFVIFSQRVDLKKENGERETLAVGTIKVACVDRDSMKPARIPNNLREKVLAYQEEKQ